MFINLYYKREENETLRFINKYNYKKILNKKKKTKYIKQQYKKTFLYLSISLLILVLIVVYFRFIFYHKSSIKQINNLYSKYINRNFSYDENAKNIFNLTRILNFNILDEYYTGITKNYSKFNHIHISFAFDNNYTLLSSITIANILNITNPENFVHFHIILANDFEYINMKKINSLKAKINNNSEFIFYNGSKAEEDFGKDIKNEKCGVGEYAKLLVSELIDEKIDRVINLDAGDLIIEKDLLELYNYPLEDYLVRGVIDPYSKCFAHWNTFMHRVNYTNAGVYLYNLKKWREMDTYHDIITFYKSFHYKNKLIMQHQDIINGFLPTVAVGDLPMKFNLFEYVTKKNGRVEGGFLFIVDCSLYVGNKKPILEAEENIVIRHFNHHKIQNGRGIYPLTKEWQENAKLTGFYDEICEKYPEGCKN